MPVIILTCNTLILVKTSGCLLENMLGENLLTLIKKCLDQSLLFFLMALDLIFDNSVRSEKLDHLLLNLNFKT